MNSIPSVTNNSDGSKTYKFPSGRYIRVGQFTTPTVNGNRTINGNYSGALPTSMNAWFTAEQFSTSVPNQICFYFDGATSSLHVGCSAANDWVKVNWIQWG